MSYRKILLCVDNSMYSGHAADQAAVIARAFEATVVAVHVYAARLHDRRFDDLEPGLPREYQEPGRLDASRRIHGSLIGKGLDIISRSYLAAVRSRLDGIAMEEKSIEGKNYAVLTAESANGYDLAVLGARGLGLSSMNGHCPPEALGSVCERFLRRVRTDVLVAKNARPTGRTILVGIDGSAESYSALRKALRLARAFGGNVEAVSCFDPDYHTVAFKAIAGVLSQEDARTFRFKEQEALHDRVINHGLENLYRGYLERANLVARGRGQEIDTRLLTGKPAYEIAALAREIEPTLLVVGRFGLHRTDDLDIGGTAETLVRLASGSVLVVNEVNESAEQRLRWTGEAEERLERVPEFMRQMVRRAIESHARSHGLTEITAEAVTSAKTTHGVRMPGHELDV